MTKSRPQFALRLHALLTACAAAMHRGNKSDRKFEGYLFPRFVAPSLPPTDTVMLESEDIKQYLLE